MSQRCHHVLQDQALSVVLLRQYERAETLFFTLSTESDALARTDPYAVGVVRGLVANFTITVKAYNTL